MNKFTPHPWNVDWMYILNTHKITIASVECGTSTNGEVFIPPTKADANARLIAAAPELLIAVDAILGALTSPHMRKDVAP